ncbi:MAG: hypothetical protein HC836_27655 [Richelia sp. RM2_1_2]|nr:hypothetical protein [Richelia sp. SM1_7_0]NJN11178.1 hypothetical protein [Richelia sp. RM1_1_1]NJO61880.1 hypothetical protein [Richelia sp. RM2_1_2]
MPSGDDERKQRLAILCKRLRGEESLRSFTKKRSKELGGITFTTWGAWEIGKAGLSPGSLARLVNFIGCSHQLLYRYLDGIVTLEELLQPTSTSDAEPNEQLDFSPDAAAVWINSLAPEEKLFIASQSFQSFQKQLDDLVEQRAEKLVEQEVKLLINLLSGDDYPRKSEIARVADKLNLKTEDLMQLCSRIYSKSRE